MKKVIKYSKVKKCANGGVVNTASPIKPKYALPNNGLPVIGQTTQSGVASTVPDQTISTEKPIELSPGSSNPVPSEGNAAMAGASTGAAAGPIGAVVGLVGGVLLNQKAQKEAGLAESRIITENYQQQGIQDAKDLEKYNKSGNYVEYYAKGGKLARNNSSSLTTGKYHTTGGGLKPLSDNAQEVIGNKHGETAIDNTSGVKLIDKDSGVPEAEVEDGEVLIDDSFVYSDRLKFDKKNTYADVARKLANKREKITTHAEKFKDSKTKAGAERQLAGLDIAEESLFNNQELTKAMQNKNNTSDMYADGGNINPKKERLATRQDSVSVQKSSRKTAEYYRSKGYKEVVERDPEKLANSMKFLDEQASRFKKENRPNTIISENTRERKVIDPGLYRQDLDKNKFNQRETANAILNLDAPVTQYDRRIQPTSISKFTAPDGLYKDDLVSVPSYADLFATEKKKVPAKSLPVAKVITSTKSSPIERPYIEGKNKVYDTDFVATSRQAVANIPSKNSITTDLLEKKNKLALDRKNKLPMYGNGGGLDEEEQGQGSQFLMSLAPNLIDNVGNAILTAKTPKLAKPLLNRAEQLKTTINVNPQLAEITDTTNAMNTNILENTSNSNVARANLAANRLEGLKQKNAIYANKENVETGLSNQASMNKQAVNASNTAILTEYQNAERARSNDIQGKISANIGNLSKDIGDAQTMLVQKDYYDQITALDAMDDKTGEKARTYSRMPSTYKNPRLRATLKAEALRKGKQ